MNQQICPKCQNVINSNFNQTLAFCTNCGASIQTLPTEKATALNSVPAFATPVSPDNYSPPKSNMFGYLLGCLGLCLLPVLGIFGYWVWSGMGNPIAKYTSQYTCTIAGEPQPVTSEDYFKRAQKHIEIDSGSGATRIDDCAMQALNEAIRLDPNNTEALRVRGYSYNLKKNYDLALADYDKAVQIEPNNPDNYSGRVYAYESKGLIDKAIENQTTILNLHLKNNSADDEKLSKEYKKRSDLYAKKGDFENAGKDVKEASRLIQKAGNDIVSELEKGENYIKKGEYDKAIEVYSGLIRKHPDLAGFYKYRANVYRKMGKNDLADADEQKAKELIAARKNKTSSESTKTSSEVKTISDLVFDAAKLGFPKPTYPPAARAVRADGEVKVQVVIDVTGKVFSAKAISGHALLRSAAEAAARQAGFQPIIFEGKPTVARGIIIYNFTLE